VPETSPPHATTAGLFGSTRGSYRRWLPNALTVIRLVIALAFFILLAVWTYPTRLLMVNPAHPVWPYLAGAALFGLAALTDAIDGPLARRWKTVSVFGRVMDPFADKVLVMGAFIMLAGPNFTFDAEGERPLQVSGVLPWMVVVMLSRELLVTSLRAMIEQSGQSFAADAFGKAKMIAQACAVPAILIVLGIFDVQRGSVGRTLIDTIAWTTVVITAISGIPYITRARRALRHVSA
jgi:CDP-diacylglycerol---glycerol-3-phosphate 3-phosphatidyltransferase